MFTSFLRNKLKSAYSFYQQEGLQQLFARKLLDRCVATYWHSKREWTLRTLYVDLDQIKIDRPIFLLGVQGAGLTFLARMIKRHYQVVSISGNYKFWAGLDEMDKNFKNIREELVVRSPGFRNMTGKEVDHSIFGVARSWVNATDDLFPAYRMQETDYDVDLENQLKMIIRKSIRAYAPNLKNARFLDKSQSYTLKIPLLRRCLDNTKFVVVIRDPYVMCWREVTAHRDRYKDWHQKPSKEEALRFAIQHWKNTYQTAVEDLRRLDDGLIIRYEDLILDTKNVLLKVLKYVGLSYSDDLLPQQTHQLPLGSQERDKWYPIRTGTNQIYLETIPKKAGAMIQESVHNFAEQFDYFNPHRKC